MSTAKLHVSHCFHKRNEIIGNLEISSKVHNFAQPLHVEYLQFCRLCFALHYPRIVNNITILGSTILLEPNDNAVSVSVLARFAEDDIFL